VMAPSFFTKKQHIARSFASQPSAMLTGAHSKAVVYLQIRKNSEYLLGQ